MSRLRGRNQNRESQETRPEGAGAAFQHKHFGAAMSRPRLIELLLALVTLLVYLPVTRNSFVNFDDDDYVTNNQVVQNGLTWAGVKWAFTTCHAGNWHPLTWLSHMLDCELFGLNAGAQHYVNVLFHTANTVLLFVLLLRLTEALWPSAFVAALFAWHPLHVESVAWVAERKDVLSAFFGLLALLAYTRYAQCVTSDRWQVARTEKVAPAPALSRVMRDVSLFYGLALIFFALGLMAKPMVVTLPFVMLLLDYWPLQRLSLSAFRFPLFLRLALEKWPFFLLSAASCVVTFLAQRHGGAVVSLGKIPLGYRLCNALQSYADYSLKMIWPAHLCLFYPLPKRFFPLNLAAAGAVLFLISAAAWLARRRGPFLIVGWLWFLGTLVPVLGLVQVGGAALADRYTYLPSIGIFIAVAFGVYEMMKRFQFLKITAPAVALLILAACSVLAAKQLSYWRDTETAFRHANVVTKDNALALFNLGCLLESQGRLGEALSDYDQALQIEPERYQVHYNCGNVLEKLGKPEEALAEFSEAERLKPDNSLLHFARGEVLAELGRLDEALAEFSEAKRLDPDYATPHFQTGMVLLKQGRDAEAVGQFREALRLDPTNSFDLAYTARALAADENPQIRDGRAALAFAEKANALSGGQPFALDALGMACAELGRFDEAQQFVQKAIDTANAVKMKDVEDLQQRLQLYQNHQPWRESFLSTNTLLKKLQKN